MNTIQYSRYDYVGFEVRAGLVRGLLYLEGE